MIDLRDWNWVVNTNDMTCTNPENEVTIKMEKIGDNLRGTLHDMPVKLFAELSEYGNGEKMIEKMVKLAEEEYMEISLSQG